MGAYIASVAIRQMICAGKTVCKAAVFILGIAFKENCSDIRNNKVIDIVLELKKYGINPEIVDPLANPAEVYGEYGISLKTVHDIKNADCIIVAVAHDILKKWIWMI